MSDITKFYKNLNALYEQLLKQYNYLSTPASVILENTNADFESDLASLQKQFDAARRGLGIVNKLSYGDTKLKHTKRVMTNLNKIRGSLKRLEQKMAQAFNLHS